MRLKLAIIIAIVVIEGSFSFWHARQRDVSSGNAVVS